MTDAADNTFLRHAAGLAARYAGCTAPNPPVGAVAVRDGRIIGEGAHRRAGEPHAEVNAVAACTEDPRGATLYVTLEPCSTTGRTPPCCDLIRRVGFARVVIGCQDPNPLHAGRGPAILREAGIVTDLAEGETAELCRTLIEPFAKRVVTGLPWLRLKLAMTLDGAIADRTGGSRWITGEAARARVQAMRLRADAVMVGAGTVRTDHPSLRPHLPGAPAKRRILVDGKTPIAPEDRDAMTWVATEDLGYDGNNPESMLRRAAELGVNEILCEGGGRLAASLLNGGFVDELLLFYAPKILGDRAARGGFDGAPRLLGDAWGFALRGAETIGEDILLTLRPKPSVC